MTERIKDIILKSSINSQMTQEELLVFLEKRKNNGLPKSINVGKRYLSIQNAVKSLNEFFNEELSIFDQSIFLSPSIISRCKDITYKLNNLYKEKVIKERAIWDKYWNESNMNMHNDWDNYMKIVDKRTLDLSQVDTDYRIKKESLFEGVHQFRNLIESEFFDVWLLTLKTYQYV